MEVDMVEALASDTEGELYASTDSLASPQPFPTLPAIVDEYATYDESLPDHEHQLEGGGGGSSGNGYHRPHSYSEGGEFVLSACTSSAYEAEFNDLSADDPCAVCVGSTANPTAWATVSAAIADLPIDQAVALLERKGYAGITKKDLEKHNAHYVENLSEDQMLNIIYKMEYTKYVKLQSYLFANVKFKNGKKVVVPNVSMMQASHMQCNNLIRLIKTSAMLKAKHKQAKR